MPGKSSAHENTILQLVFNGTINAKLAGIYGVPTTPLENLYISLHTGDPGDADSQATSECAYRAMSDLFKLAATL